MPKVKITNLKPGACVVNSLQLTIPGYGSVLRDESVSEDSDLIELQSFVLSLVQINTDLNTILVINREIGKGEQVLIASEENSEPILSIGEKKFIAETITLVKNVDIKENFCKHTTLNRLQTTPSRDLILITVLPSVYLVMKKFMGKRLVPLASSLKTVLNAASPYREKDIIAGLVGL